MILNGVHIYLTFDCVNITFIVSYRFDLGRDKRGNWEQN